MTTKIKSSNFTTPISVNISGGSIENTIIGANTAAAGTFTDLNVNTDLFVSDKIIHSGDTNTAIRFPAADIVTVETNGAERLRVDSSGNIGIGTASPGYLLDVRGSDTLDLFRVLATSDATGGSAASFTVTAAPNLISLITGTADSLVFGTDFTERMRISSAGNVGIGTNSPSTRLDVNGTTNSTAYQKTGVAGKILVKSQYLTSGTNFSTTGTTNVVLSSIINYVPASASSQVWVTITAYVQLNQTGGDNDARASLYAYSFQSNGTTRISAVGLSDATTDNTVGFIDGSNNERVEHCITIQGECARATDGDVYVRLWGSRVEDTTAGFAMTFTMAVCDFLFVEYL
jgi:hypothetical protein